MSERRQARDLSDRTLAVMVRLLPSHRAEWGLAMRAELASLDDAGTRRRYALGCMRAVLRDHTAMRTVALHVVAVMFGAVAVAFAISINGVGVQIETILFVSALGVLAWAGRRRGPLGPTADHPPARRVRATGYVVLGAYILPALGSFAGASPRHDQSGVWMFYVAVSLYLATLLLVTAQRTAARPRTLYLIAVVTVAGLAAWWVPMLLNASVRAHPSWALLTVAGTVTVGLVIATVLRWPSRQAAFAALSAGVAISLLVFLAAQSTYIVNPSLVPNLGRVPGMTAGAEVEQNRAEAVDPYVAELLLGAVLGAVLIAATSASRAVVRNSNAAGGGPGLAPGSQSTDST
jgi:MFS family permease